MFRFCNADLCVRLKDKTGIQSSLTGFLIIFLIVVASHEAWEFCFWSKVPLRIAPICLPLSRAWSWISSMFLFDASMGLVPLGLVWVSVGELNVIFNIVLDDDNFFSEAFQSTNCHFKLNNSWGEFDVCIIGTHRAEEKVSPSKGIFFKENRIMLYQVA